MKVFSALFLILIPASCLFSQSFVGESVEYDPEGDRFFTSSDGTSIVQRAANGEVSYFGTGLLASYGMEVMNGSLYTIDENMVYEYDLITETQVSVVTVPGGGFLNGMGSDASTDRIWVTSFSAGRIYEIDYSESIPEAVSVVPNTADTPNGIWHDAENDRLLYVTWGTGFIKSVDLNDGYAVSTELNVGVSNIDGIDENNEGDLYLSSWSPTRISRVSSDLSSIETVTVLGLNNPADICYALETDTLAIPSTSSAMIFVGFLVDDIDEQENAIGVTLFPNPSTGTSVLGFDLDDAQEMTVTILDMDGKEVQDLGTVLYPAGSNQLIVSTADWSAGLYFIQLTSEGQVSFERMVVVD